MLPLARPLFLLLLVSSILSVGLVGCAQLSPADQVEAARAQTSVELRSFAVREEPVEQPAEMEGEEDETAAEESSDAESADQESADEMADAGVPVSVEVDLDLLVSSEADDPLDGITVEFEQVDVDRNPKDTRRLWLETPDLMRGVGAQYTLTVQDVDYVEGDGFSVTVRSPIPEAERSEYREFQGAGES